LRNLINSRDDKQESLCWRDIRELGSSMSGGEGVQADRAKEYIIKI